MDTRLSPWQLQKRNRNTNWASLSDGGQKNRSLTIMTQIHLWFLKTPFLWFALVPPSPLLSICRYRHGIVILFGCVCRSSNTCALEDILTMGEELRRKPVSGFAVYWLQMWWELNWFTLWDQHDNLLALGLQWATQVGNRHLGRAWKSVFVVVAMMTDRYVHSWRSDSLPAPDPAWVKKKKWIAHVVITY